MVLSIKKRRKPRRHAMKDLAAMRVPKLKHLAKPKLLRRYQAVIDGQLVWVRVFEMVKLA